VEAALFPVVLPTYNRADVAFVRGEGSYLFAEDGKRYLDFGSGVAVNAFGHAHPRLIKALTDQASRVWHTSNLYRVPGQESLASQLVAHSFADTVFFTNSGTEAIELSIKMARRFHFMNGQPDRFHVITFEGAFHGRTIAAISAGGNPKYIEGFGPKLDGFIQVPLNDLKATQDAITDQTAAFLIEPIQGEGGMRAANPDFLRALRNLADERGILLIFDEIQCGAGRTGKLFAHERVGVTPDILTSAKGIGGGFPIGAVLATADAAKGMTAGTHGSTYGGNPLGMAVGNEAVTMMLEEGFLDSVAMAGNYLRQQLAGLVASHPDVFEEVRGTGLMLGLKLKPPVGDFVNAARVAGLLTVGAGENVVRILPPLNVSESELREAVAMLETAAMAMEKQKEAAQ